MLPRHPEAQAPRGFPAVEKRSKRDLRNRILLIKRQRLQRILLGAW